MKKNRKLLVRGKRLLAFVLAATMVTGTLPSSVAYAAEIPDTAAEASVDVADSALDVTSPDETPGVEEGAGDQAAVEAAVSEVAPETEETQDKELTAEGETQTQSPQAVISITENNLVGVASDYSGLAYDYTTRSLEAAYIPADVAGDGAWASVVLNAVKNGTTVKVDDSVSTVAKSHVQYTWNKRTVNAATGEEELQALGDTLPQDAGDYQLVLSLDKVEGLCEAADPVSVNLTIRKNHISLDLDNVSRNFEPGTTVAEVKTEWQKYAFDSVSAYDNSWNVTKDAAVKESKIIVKKALTGEELADTAVLQKNVDYTVTVQVTLKDEFAANYEVEEENSQTYNIHMGAAVATEIQITYADETKALGKTYDGTGFAFGEKDYTAKVVYTKDSAEKEIADAVITGQWCDANKEVYENDQVEPVDAGTYYYKLSYTDANSVYADSEAYVKVVITTADIIIKPELAVTEFNEGTQVSAIVKAATYKVFGFDADGKQNETAETVNEYDWGTVYNVDSTGSDTTQSYEPVFVVQRGIVTTTTDKDNKEVTNTVWSTLEDTDTLSVPEQDAKYSYVYRLVFSGKKAVYDASGAQNYVADINASQDNYAVRLTTKDIEDNAVILTVGAPVTIDVSGILEDKLGREAYEYKQGETTALVYTGKSIYATKDLYKKAVAKAGETELAKNTDSSLVYTWQRATSYTVDADGNRSVSRWSTYSYNNVESQSAPYSAGEYRLQVSYYDAETGCTSQTPGYVYYTILPQDVKAVVTAAPKVYAGDLTVAEFLDTLQSKDETATDTYVQTAIYAVTDKIGTKGDAITDSFPEYRNSFYVERKITEGEKKDQWEVVASDSTFKEGVEYRLNVNIVSPNGYSFSNYNFGKNLDAHGRTQTDVNDLWSNETAAIEVLKTEGIELAIDIDESQIQNHVKVYDGTPFDLTAVKGLIKIREVKTGKDVTAELASKVTYTWKTTYNHQQEIWSETEAVHGGDYTLCLTTQTDATYKGLDAELTTLFTIEQRELVVTPKLRSEIKAGTYFYRWNSFETNDAITADVPEVAGYADVDQGQQVIGSFSGHVYSAEQGGTSYYSGYLKSGETYYVAYDDDEDNFNSRYDEGYGDYISYGRDYKINAVRAAFVPVKAAGSAETLGDSTYKTTVKDVVSGTAAEGYTHTVTPVEGIPYITNYTYGSYAEGLTGTAGNVLTFAVYAPKEFANTDDSDFVYENDIQAAGGYVVGTISKWLTEDNYDYDDYYLPGILVAFRVDEATLKNQAEWPSFTVLWDTDYAEVFTVDYSGAILEDDLSKAVAPKSLSFNGANTKMAVGETQQLDVKVTKAQMGDVILLGYASDNENAVSVSQSGYVTAVAAGTATITVYPCYLENGVKTAISGAKTAKVKISVSDVAAPKVSKVAAKDTTATVQYTKPANGYRREIYVLEGKRSVQDFESTIASVKNGNYSAFVYTNLNVDESQQDKKGVVKTTVESLSPVSDYTVYVRNVSGLRILDDGSSLAVSFAGGVKTFKTAKAMNQEITAYFDETAKGQTAIWDEDEECYIAKLTDKTAPLSVDAKFLQGKNYSDAKDYIWRTLPLGKDDKNAYADPKMQYYALEGYDYDSGVYYEVPTIVTTDSGYKYLRVGYLTGYFSDIATVDKKGKVTFKGKGDVIIYAVATDTLNESMVNLRITANPDSLKAKSVKMSVGQTINLTDYLEYQEGKTKVVDYQYSYADLSVSYDREAAEEYFTINQYGSGCSVTALKPGGKLELTVTDKTVDQNAGQSVPVKLTITTSVVDPVKNLKASYVADDRFTVTYSYPRFVYSFRYDLKDARGKTIRSEIVQNQYYTTYNTKTKTYDYEVTFTEGLTRLSNYTLTVTAIYNGQESKAVNLKVKTTNIPASYQSLESWEYGGTNLTVATAGGGSRYLSNYNSVVLKSGNTYTLDLPLDTSMDNLEAKVSKTDTLIWKSTNPKVATVKANAGTFNATLKAVKQGTTVIEVSSKLTKSVIARYKVSVNAVGDANGYFGDNAYEAVTWPNDADCIELTLNNAMYATLNAGESQWFVFTAPAYGYYNLYKDYSSYVTANVYKDLNGTGASWSGVLEKGAKRYICVKNTTSSQKTGYVRVTGNVYTEIALDKDNLVKGGSTVAFTAASDNYYTFSYVNEEGAEEVLWSGSLSKDATKTLNLGTYELSDTLKEYTVRVKCRKATALAVSDSGTAVTVAKDAENWYSFTAPEKGYYTIYSTGADAQLTARVYTSLSSSSSASVSVTDKDFKLSDRKMSAGETIYLKVTSSEATDEKAAAATIKVEKAVSVTDGKATLKAGTTAKKVTYTVPEDGNYRFTFSTTTDGADITSVTGYNESYDEYLTETTENVYEGEFEKNDFVTLNVTASADAEVTVAVSKVNDNVIAVGAANTVALTAKVPERVKFSAAESGWYTFKVSDPAEGSTLTQNTLPELTYLGQGETVFYQIAADKAQSVTVTITKLPVTTLTSENTVKVAAGETKFYKYTAAKEGLYDFEVTANDVTITQASTLSFDDWESLTTGTVYRKAGQVTYVRLKNAGEAEAEVQIKISAVNVADLTLGTAKELTVAAGKSAWVAFTTTKQSRYLYQVEDGTDFDIRSYSSLANVSDGYEADAGFQSYYGSTLGVVSGAGEKYYYQVRNTGSEEKKVKLTVSEVTASTTASLKNGEGAWLVFTSDKQETTRFIIQGKAVLADKTPTAVIENTIEKLTDYYADYEYGEVSKILNAGQSYYFYVVASCDEGDTVEVSLDVKAAGEDGALDKADGIQFAANETKSLTYSVTEDGYYALDALVGDAQASNLSIKYYKNLENSANYLGTDNGVVKFEKGDTLNFMVTSYEAQTVKFSFTKAQTLTSADQTVTLKNGESKWFVLDEKEYTRYFIETSDVAEGLTLASTVDYNLSDYSYEMGNIANTGYYSFVGTSEGVYVFKLTATVSGEDAKSFKIKGDAVAPIALTVGTTQTIAKDQVKAGHYTWYKFTATEEGRYEFSLTNAKAKYKSTITSYFGSDGTFPYSTKMSQDGVSYFAVYCDTVPDADVVLRVTEITDETVQVLSESDAAQTLTLQPGEGKWYSFTAKKAGVYTFDIQEAGTTSVVSSTVYTDLTTTSSTSYKTVAMDAGETVYLRLYVSNSKTQGTSVDLKVVNNELTAVTLSEAGSVTLDGSTATKYMCFEAPEDGSYKFTRSTGSGVTVYYGTAPGSGYYTVSTSGTYYTMTQGQKLYFRVINTSYSGTLTVTAAKN